MTELAAAKEERDTISTDMHEMLPPAAGGRAMTALEHFDAYEAGFEFEPGVGLTIRPSEGDAWLSWDETRKLVAWLSEVAGCRDRIGRWLSAALDDPKVCDEMKADIRAWMDTAP